MGPSLRARACVCVRVFVHVCVSVCACRTLISSHQGTAWPGIRHLQRDPLTVDTLLLLVLRGRCVVWCSFVLCCGDPGLFPNKE